MHAGECRPGVDGACRASTRALQRPHVLQLSVRGLRPTAVGVWAAVTEFVGLLGDFVSQKYVLNTLFGRQRKEAPMEQTIERGLTSALNSIGAVGASILVSALPA